MSAPELLQALAPVIATLDKLSITYYVGGSVASSVYGVARTTLDADLVALLRDEHVGALVEELRAGYYVSAPMIRSAIKSHSRFNVIHLATMFKVDVFTVKSRPFDQSALQRIRKDTLGSEEPLEVFVASAEDVLLNKLEWYRIGEEISERQWTDVLGVLRVQRNVLDYEYLRRWATDLEVLDLLERACTETGIT